MKVDFDKVGGLVPAVVQHAESGAVLMLGYMNEEALQQTEETGLVTFYSRSKKRLWVKGETSGNTLAVQKVSVDCDGDALLIYALPHGPTCHKGMNSCFGQDVPDNFGFLFALEDIIRDRQENPVDKSYTNSLFSKGIKKIAQKVGEEGVEVALEGVLGDKESLKSEAADLVYHLLVLLRANDISLASVCNILQERNSS